MNYINELPPLSHIMKMSDFRKRISEAIRLLEEDRRTSILVTKKGNPSFVVLSLEAYKELMRQ